MKNELRKEVAEKYNLKEGFEATEIITPPNKENTRYTVNLKTVSLERIEELLKQGVRLPLVPKTNQELSDKKTKA